MELELELYTPSEAEEITEVTQVTVRNWRRAGHLQRQQGHARYTIADILNMTAMQALVTRGMAPESAKGFAGEIARAIFQSMIWDAKAYSAAAAAAAKSEMPATSPDTIERAQAAVGAAFSPTTLAAIEAAAFMAKAAGKAFGVSGLKSPSWFIIWANGESQFYYAEDISEETFFGNMAFDEFVQGPVIMFCLGALAKMVIDRLPRPAIKLVGEA